MNYKKIGIDCRMIGESGIGRYIYNLIKNYALIDKNTSYYLFVLDSKNFELELPNNFKLIEAPFKWHSFDEQTKFLNLINSYKLDLFHSPHPNMPYFYQGRFVLTIHDLTMLKEVTGRASTYFYPIYFIKWFVFKVMLQRAAHRAEKIITVSNFVKEEIIKNLNVAESKVEVIYNGVPDTISKKSSVEVIDVLEKFKINKPYLFYVGNAYPHKNLENLITAFTLFNKNQKFFLVLGGKEDFFYKRLKSEYKKLEDIIFLGELSDNEISCLYSGSATFIYPSISEGFGIQIIEAIKCEARIMCSDNSSFPEIAGDYAYYFNPFSIESIVNCISQNIDKDFTSKILETQKRLKIFDWKISAQKHYELYQQN